MSEKGQPLPYPLDECAGCRDLEQQLAQQLQQLGAITLALNDVGCPLDESGSDFILRQAQQLAQVEQERDDLRKDRDDAVDMREGSLLRVDGLQQQLAQAKAEIALLKTLYEADMGRTLPEVER